MVIEEVENRKGFFIQLGVTYVPCASWFLRARLTASGLRM
jgi:hypothetical protein